MTVQAKTADRIGILVVEDEPLIAEDLVQSLNDFGYSVVGVASNASEAVHMAMESGPDLILMDIVLGGDSDGIEAAAEIKSRLSIPIVYVTAYTDEALLQRAKETRPAGYVVKPFRTSELRANVEIALYRGEMERKLAQSEERYRAVVDTQAELICRYAPDGTLTFVNEAFRRYLGRDADELIGRRFLIPIVEDDRARAEISPSSFCPALPVQFHEFRVNAPDDEVRWLSWLDRALFDGKGEIIEFQGVGQDITDRKRAELELRAQRACFTSIVETSSEAIMVISRGRMVLYANESATHFLGKSREDLVGSIFDHPLEPETIADVPVAQPDGKPGVAEMRVESTKWLGEQAWLVKLQDITQRRLLEKQLWEIQKMDSLGTLAGGIAHDFNNLLTVIHGNAEILLSQKERGDSEYEDLEQILRATQNGARLVRRILTFCRRMEADLQPVDLNREIRQIRNLLSRTIPKTIEIKLILSEDLRLVSADRSQIEQVILNLAVNAKDAMQAGGEVIIKTKNMALDQEYCTLHPGTQPGEHVVLEVSDTGHGMEKDVLERVFDPFFTTKEPGKGTGLGLATVFGIVKVHQGHIQCSSQPGMGTAFRIYLPAAESKSRLGPDTISTIPVGGTETVLIVDEDQAILNMMRKLLSRAGYTVLTGPIGKETLEMVQGYDGDIHLVILDAGMPGGKNDQFLVTMQSLVPQAKILLTSCQSVGGTTKMEGTPRAEMVIGKPFRATVLLKTVRDLLDAG